MNSTEYLPLLMLDVRPLIEQGHDPLEEILQALDRLSSDGLLLLITPFRPGPLITLLEQRGYRLRETELGQDHWQVEILTAATPEIADYRNLPTPEPLERVLTQVATLPPNGAFLARVPRVPTLLFPLLKERQLDWATLEITDGSAFIFIKRAGNTA
ncbi:MAG: DUF2249 domain-containing protein [Gammaproteobacteria bacterium]|jgi:uncharacterized protein (DUF2249 family)|nr:hypothetical protein [Chromatiales bacterium]MDP6675250.1 DUF2249 domain-containing protein [Gammaproteobacteria bacterium]